MTISAQEARLLLSLEEKKKVKGGISAEEAKKLLAENTNRNGTGDDIAYTVQEEPYELDKALPAFLAGAGKGLLNIGGNINRLESKGIDKLFGTKFEGAAPEVQLPQAMQNAMQQYPTTSGVGEFAGEAAPLALMPASWGGELASAAPYISKLPKALQGAASLTGRAAKGATVGAGIAPVYDQNMEEGGAIGGIGSLLGPAAGQARRTMGSLMKMGGTATSEEAMEAQQAAKRLGINLPLGETIGSPALKSLQSSVLTSLPFAGMGKEYVNIGNSLKSQVGDFLKGIEPENKELVNRNLQGAVIKAKSAAEKEKTILYKDVEDIAEKTNEKVALENYRNTVNRIYSDIKEDAKHNPEFEDPYKSSIYKILKEGSKKEDLSYSGAFNLNKKINFAIQQLSPEDYQTKSLLSQLKSAINQDIEKSAENSGNESLVKSWRKANKHFQENVAPLRENQIEKFTKSNADVDTIIPTFIKGGAYERPQLLKKLTKHLTDKEKDHVVHQYLTKSLREVGDKTEIKEDSVINAYSKLGNQEKRELFSKEKRQQMDDILKIRKMTGMDLNQMISPKTGEKTAKALAIASPLLALKAGAAPMAAGVLAGGRGLKEMIMSDFMKSLYQKGIKKSQQPSPEIGRGAYLGLPATDSRNK